MGLDVSHDAFHGSYSAFNRFRQAVAAASGGSFPPHKDESLKANIWYVGESFSQETHPGLFAFLNHSDCEGTISVEMCDKVANDLEALLPAIGALERKSHGHIEMRGGYVEVTRKFIVGCRAAHAENVPLEFG